MAVTKKVNLLDLVGNYDIEFINSISLKDVKNNKDLKELLIKVEKANDVITSYYTTLYNDYIETINSECELNPCGFEINTVVKYRDLAYKIHKLYNYILYISMFENPFKRIKK